jgi:CxxC motif-containing protein (DUF1111 family)
MAMRSDALLRLGALALLAWPLAGCAGGTEVKEPTVTGDGTGASSEANAGGAHSDGSGARTAAAPNGGPSSVSAGAQDPGPAVAPTLACGGRPPAPFIGACSGCHKLGDNQDPSIPDLRKASFSEAELIAQVRSGGGAMPAFSAELVSDAALKEVYAFLQGQRDKKTPALSLGSVKPLFAGDARAYPITFLRDDGVLITRGAGRVRQRHELEGTYNPFGPHYFEDRTYGFLIEDYTPKGESRIRVTYLPVARPEDKTNFRCFKVYGNGNVFSSNTGMVSDGALPSLAHGGKPLSNDYTREVAPYARVQMHEVTNNARTSKPLAKGDQFEFEFGIFIEASEVSAGSRTSYYTDTFRYRVGLGGLTAENFDTSGSLGPVSRANEGGATTIAWIYAEPETYFSQMALNIQHEHVQPFVEGRRLFHTDFASGEHSEPGNPVFNEQAKKLGPKYVTTSCERCHKGNGGGRTLAGTFDENSSLAFKLYGDAAMGNQLQLSEGSARFVSSATSSVTLSDGSVVQLSRPSFEVKSASGATPRYSARVARRLVGLGLLEALSEETLLAQADPDDCDGDGISGRASLIADPESGALRVGRFGWRAEKVSVEHQVADALDADLGVTSRIVPGAQGAIELNDQDLARLTTYMRLLGVPAQRDVDDAQVKQGESVFRSVGCASCHLPALTTGDTHPNVELRAQQIRPFTDLLLHDLGADLRDDSGEGGDGSGTKAASASEWRTAPLWGIGLARTVQGYVALLHDGRAQSVLEAVLWHAGEAGAVRERFIKLNKEEREALLRFVESL